jgi:PAS domain S-box-containing protein
MTDRLENLRKLAETALQSGETRLHDIPDALKKDLSALLEELRVYQAELELQNRELLDTRSKVDQAHEHYAKLFMYLPLPALVVDSKGLLKEFNEAAYRCLDISSSALRAYQSLFRLLSDQDDASTLTLTLQEASVKVDLGLTPTIAFRNRQGDDVPFAVHCYRIGEDDIQMDHRVVLLVNRSVEMRLADQEAQLRTILSSVLDAILTTDVEGRIILFNPAAERMFGYRASEVKGANLAMLMPDDVGERHPSLMQSYMLSTQSGNRNEIRREVRAKRRDGSIFPADLAINEFWMEGQRFFTSAIRDVSERKHYEAELISAREAAEAANQAKSAFLAAMSHEIRTPMSGIIGLVDLLGLSPLNPDQAAMIPRIKESAFSLLSIIDEILDFSKIEANKLTLEHTAVSLQQVVRAVCGTLQPLAERKRLKLQCHCDPALPDWVYTDPVRLRQILFNLVGNAVKFTQHSGQVSLEVVCRYVDAQRCHVHFQVVDNGIGIAADKLPQLFKPFSQAESSTTRRFGGTGLGLSICARLVKIMGGALNVDSQPGQGATFYFDLEFECASEPLADTNTLATMQQLSLAESPEIDAARAAGQLILVAEDNETNQTVISYQLNALGYAAEVVGDGLQALERLRTGRYALLLTDYHMPNLDGLALIAAVREIERCSNAKPLPIVVLTANAIKGEAERFLDAGADDVLTKPVVLEGMHRVLMQWMPSAHSPSADSPPEEAVTPFSQETTVDISVLERVIGDDPAVVQMVLQEFLHSAAATIECLQSADLAPVAISQQAHRLKSSARSVGAQRLGELCQSLENAGKAEDVQALPALLAALNTEWQVVEQFIRGYSR